MKWTSGRLYRNRKLLLTVSGLVIPLLLSALLLGEKTFVTSVIHGVFYSPFWALSNKVTSLLHVYKDNVDLQAQIVRLKFQERRNELDRVENARYRDMMLLLPREGYHMIPADVVAYDQGRRLSTAVIKASEEMERFRAVVDENGIVGKISSTSGTTATVSLLVGPNCRVAARDVRTQALGIVKWYSGRGLYLDDVALDADVEQGDTLVSSGLGGVFPEGISIGVVDTIETSSSAFFKQIRIDPFVDFGSLDVVMVMEPVEVTPRGF